MMKNDGKYYRHAWWKMSDPIHDIEDNFSCDHVGIFDEQGKDVELDFDEQWICGCDPHTGKECLMYSGIRGDGSLCKYAKHIIINKMITLSVLSTPFCLDEYLCMGKGGIKYDNLFGYYLGGYKKTKENVETAIPDTTCLPLKGIEVRCSSAATDIFPALPILDDNSVIEYNPVLDAKETIKDNPIVDGRNTVTDISNIDSYFPGMANICDRINKPKWYIRIFRLITKFIKDTILDTYNYIRSVD